jgi:ADP-heptose:LPS heptosyltransferase
LKILVIQTAFIGDVVLATPVIEKLRKFYPEAQIDFLLRRGNESLFDGHPYLHRVIVWDKKQNKFANLLKIIEFIRKERYDIAINVHRFASSGLVMLFSKAKEKIGFDKNPFSFCYTKKVKHVIGNRKHETERNLELVESITDSNKAQPCLYPDATDYEKVKEFKNLPYICIAPSSVWFTKQFPSHKWIEFINKVRGRYRVYLLGSAMDLGLCDKIKDEANNNESVHNLAGKLSFLQTAALMKDAEMNYVNDSAPMHIASSVNAQVTAIFCSTIPAFGFGPLSEKSFIVETDEKLDCRPCGLHGYKVCPQGHFKCAETISIDSLISKLA